MRNKIFILIGPGGAGKTTLAKEVLRKEKYIPELVSHTNRAPREGEEHGVDYYFVSDEEINNLNKMEEASHGDYQYSLSKKEIDSKMSSDNINKSFVIMNQEGVEQMKERYDGEIVVVYITCDKSHAYKRMVDRDGKEAARERYSNDLLLDMFNLEDYADYTIINDDGKLELSKKDLLYIVKERE